MTIRFCVTAIVENEAGEILLVLNRSRAWEVPGGKVKPGERWRDAIVREVKEETGLDVALNSGEPLAIEEGSDVILLFHGRAEGHPKPEDPDRLIAACWVDRSNMGVVTLSDLASARHVRAWASGECTGTTATWCPVHGQCRCPCQDDNPDNGRTLDDHACPLHAPTSAHAEEPGEAESSARDAFRTLLRGLDGRAARAADRPEEYDPAACYTYAADGIRRALGIDPLRPGACATPEDVSDARVAAASRAEPGANYSLEEIRRKTGAFNRERESMPPADREILGRIVREEWVSWAREQANPKASWLAPWEALSEPEREVDRRIGERLFAKGKAAQRFCEECHRSVGAVAHVDCEAPALGLVGEELGYRPGSLDRAVETMGKAVAAQAKPPPRDCPGCHLATWRDDDVAWCTDCEPPAMLSRKDALLRLTRDCRVTERGAERLLNFPREAIEHPGTVERIRDILRAHVKRQDTVCIPGTRVVPTYDPNLDTPRRERDEQVLARYSGKPGIVQERGDVSVDSSVLVLHENGWTMWWDVNELAVSVAEPAKRQVASRDVRWIPEPGDRVQTTPFVDGYTNAEHAVRREGLGAIVGPSGRHERDYNVRHDDGTVAPYDADEIMPVRGASASRAEGDGPSAEDAAVTADGRRAPAIAPDAVERCCEVFAAITEAQRGDGQSFWYGADDAQRATTRDTVEYLLSDNSLASWVNPERAANLRRVLRIVAGATGDAHEAKVHSTPTEFPGAVCACGMPAVVTDCNALGEFGAAYCSEHKGNVDVRGIWLATGKPITMGRERQSATSAVGRRDSRVDGVAAAEEAEIALGELGIPDDGRTLAERIRALASRVNDPSGVWARLDALAGKVADIGDRLSAPRRPATADTWIAWRGSESDFVTDMRAEIPADKIAAIVRLAAAPPASNGLVTTRENG